MFKFCWSNHFQNHFTNISKTFTDFRKCMTLLYVCNPCTLPQKELADSFLFLLNFAYDTVKVGECTKGHAKKGEKRKNCKNSIGGQWQLEWPMLWRIMIVPKHNQDIYKWVNSGKIFFWNELLLVLSSLQKSEFLKLIILFFH